MKKNQEKSEENDTTNCNQSPTSDELKEKGNECVKKGNFIEAILHYTHAIKVNPIDPILYSNRSLAFLKSNQLYYAKKDAEKTIQLKSDWAKGYFRDAEVQLAAGQYDSALLLYGRALQLQPNDSSILNAAKRAAMLSNQQTDYERKVPWVGAGIGIILGVLIVMADQLQFTKKKTITHPSLMVFIVIVVSIIGFIIAKLYRHYIRTQKACLLDPPVDLLPDFKETEPPVEEETEQTTNRNRYTKAQARQRFKKGKT